MSPLLLRNAVHRRYVGPLADDEASLEEISGVLARLVARDIASCTDGLGSQDIGASFLCSTILDLAFSSQAVGWHRLQRSMTAYTLHPPQVLVNAYECAAWGYCLRYAIGRKAKAPFVLCVIADLNILNFDFWRRNDNGGDSGFGVTVLLFELHAGVEQQLVVGVAKTANAIAEFTIAVREEAAKRGQSTVALPFFPAHITDLFNRLISNAQRAPDLHSQVGHCFGADPWLSIIRDEAGRARDSRYLAASVALNGYWAMAEVETSRNGLFRFSEERL